MTFVGRVAAAVGISLVLTLLLLLIFQADVPRSAREESLVEATPQMKSPIRPISLR